MKELIQGLDGEVEDFRDIEELTDFLVFGDYCVSEVMDYVSSDEARQKLGYITNVSYLHSIHKNRENPSLIKLMEILEEWKIGKVLKEVKFSDHPVSERNELSYKWNVLTNYGVSDLPHKIYKAEKCKLVDV